MREGNDAVLRGTGDINKVEREWNKLRVSLRVLSLFHQFPRGNILYLRVYIDKCVCVCIYVWCWLCGDAFYLADAIAANEWNKQVYKDNTIRRRSSWIPQIQIYAYTQLGILLMENFSVPFRQFDWTAHALKYIHIYMYTCVYRYIFWATWLTIYDLAVFSVKSKIYKFFSLWEENKYKKKN